MKARFTRLVQRFFGVQLSHGRDLLEENGTPLGKIERWSKAAHKNRYGESDPSRIDVHIVVRTR